MKIRKRKFPIWFVATLPRPNKISKLPGVCVMVSVLSVVVIGELFLVMIVLVNTSLFFMVFVVGGVDVSCFCLYRSLLRSLLSLYLDVVAVVVAVVVVVVLLEMNRCCSKLFLGKVFSFVTK